MKNNEKMFTHIVSDYIKEKRAIGYNFHKAAQVLRRIVHLQDDIDHGQPILSEELVNRWIEKTAWENDTNRSQRISVLRGLGTYMVRMGYDAKAIPRRLAPQRDYPYTPYIFSEHELGLVLGSIDRLCEYGISRHSDLTFPIVFRILIGCGTRITETLRIEKNDIDLENGTLILRHTKDAKERIIPIAASIVERCRLYETKCQVLRNVNFTPWFFPNRHGEPYSSNTAYNLFRRALAVAGISHGGKGKGPRLHDLRHTYAVRVLNKWVQTGNNLTTALPYLAIYMGHDGMKASQHYLRLTATMFPELVGLPMKKAPRPTMSFFSPEGLHQLLKQPNINTKSGRRDHAMLVFLYDTAARVQEIIDLAVRDIRLEQPATVVLHGKGRKTRIVPISAKTASIMEQYLKEKGYIYATETIDYPVFTNSRNCKLTRAGISHILARHVKSMAIINSHLVPKPVSPHFLRHSKAVHLLRSGVPLIYIRDFLGHASVKTTEIYAKVDAEETRKALEEAYEVPSQEDIPAWENDKSLMSWLSELCR